MELFLFFAGLLRRFVFQPPPGVNKAELDLTADVGFTLSPMPHLVCAVPLCGAAVPGVFFSIGDLWRTTRRFTVSSMRNLGMGKQMMEGKVCEELHFLIEKIKSFKGEPFSLRSFSIAPINITFLMLFGDRFDYKDPTFLTLLRLIDEVMVLLGSPYLNVSNLSQRLAFFPGQSTSYWWRSSFH